LQGWGYAVLPLVVLPHHQGVRPRARLGPGSAL